MKMIFMELYGLIASIHDMKSESVNLRSWHPAQLAAPQQFLITNQNCIHAERHAAIYR